MFSSFEETTLFASVGFFMTLLLLVDVMVASYEGTGEGAAVQLAEDNRVLCCCAVA